jgi:hypothetical protein
MKAHAQCCPAATGGDRRPLGIESVPRNENEGLPLPCRQAANGIDDVPIDLHRLCIWLRRFAEVVRIDETVAQGLPAPSAAIAIRNVPAGCCEEPRHGVLGHSVQLPPGGQKRFGQNIMNVIDRNPPRRVTRDSARMQLIERSEAGLRAGSQSPSSGLANS